MSCESRRSIVRVSELFDRAESSGKTHAKDRLCFTISEPDFTSPFTLVVISVLLRPLDTRFINLYSLDLIKLIRQRDRKQSRSTISVDQISLNVISSRCFNSYSIFDIVE